MAVSESTKPYPHWVCNDCGIKAANASQTDIFQVSCWHEGDCEVCDKQVMVTEARDFGYPDFEGHVSLNYTQWDGKHPIDIQFPYIDTPLFQADKVEPIDKRRIYLKHKKKAAIIGSTQYGGKFHALKMELEYQGYIVKMPAFDSDKDKDELQVCEHNRAMIEWADVVYVIWDARSVGTIFDFGMCFAMRKPIIIHYIESKTFAGVMEKYAAECAKKEMT
jgi:nucleoside 2-deoxyribosyltransferase